MENRRVDLHGLSWREAKMAFVAMFNQEISRARGGTAKPIDVVHGYGSTGEGGVIRLRLKRFLERHGGSLTFFPGGEIDANLGHTLVYPLFPLPSPTQELDQMILDFCDQGKISEIWGVWGSRGSSKTGTTETVRI